MDNIKEILTIAISGYIALAIYIYRTSIRRLDRIEKILFKLEKKIIIMEERYNEKN